MNIKPAPSSHHFIDVLPRALHHHHSSRLSQAFIHAPSTQSSSNPLVFSPSNIMRKRKGTFLQRVISVRVLLVVVVAFLVGVIGVVSLGTTIISLKATTSDLSEQILQNVMLRVVGETEDLFSDPYELGYTTYLQLDNKFDLNFTVTQPLLWRAWKGSVGVIESLKLLLPNGDYVAYFGDYEAPMESLRNQSIEFEGKASPVVDFTNGLANFTNAPANVYSFTSLGWYKQLLNEKIQLWSTAYRLPVGVPQVQYTNAYPILDPATSDLLGAFAISVSSLSLKDTLANITISKNAKLWIMEPSGALIACNDPNEVMYAENTTYITYGQHSNIQLVRETSSRIIGSNDARYSYQYMYQLHGSEINSHVYRLQNYGMELMLVVAYPASDFLKAVQLVQRNIIIITLKLWVMFLITKPLSFLGRQMDEISLGEFNSHLLDRSAGPTTSRLYEIGSLEQDFRRMVTAIKSFGKYVPTQIVRHLLQDDAEAVAAVSQKDLTVMFSDIKGFTQKVEEMSPAQLSMLLSDYLSAMCAVIVENDGTVDKFIGDAIMALWNVPSPTKRHPILACSAALQSLKALETLNVKWRTDGLPEIQCRMGIHTGRALVGNLGSKDRLSYTAVGDNVNLGSRLESLNKKYGQVHHAVKAEFLCRYLDIVVVQGRTTPTKIFELVTKLDEATTEQKALCKAQGDAVELLFAKKFDKALEILNTLQQDTSVKVLIERALEAQSISRIIY